MTSLIASKSPWEGGKRNELFFFFCFFVPRHKLLPFVKHTSPSLPRDLLLRTCLDDELRHRDQISKTRIPVEFGSSSSSVFEEENEERGGETQRRNDLILDGNRERVI